MLHSISSFHCKHISCSLTATTDRRVFLNTKEKMKLIKRQTSSNPQTTFPDHSGLLFVACVQEQTASDVLLLGILITVNEMDAVTFFFIKAVLWLFLHNS